MLQIIEIKSVIMLSLLIESDLINSFSGFSDKVIYPMNNS